MYSEKVMDHFSNPRNVGEIEDANAVGQVGNPKCGDIMKMYMKINDDTKVIEEVKFKTFGCGAAVATSRGSGRTSAGQDALLQPRTGGNTFGDCGLLQQTGNRPDRYSRLQRQLLMLPCGTRTRGRISGRNEGSQDKRDGMLVKFHLGGAGKKDSERTN